MKMNSVYTAVLMMVLLVGVALASTGKVSSMEFKAIKHLVGTKALKEFIRSPQLTVVYYYMKDMHRIKYFFKELDKSAEYLDLYGVKVGVCDCQVEDKSEIKECGIELVEENIYTYRRGRVDNQFAYAQFFDTHSILSYVLHGSQLLSLELDTMFDVNSIMSNVLQLVLLRQVPIVQTPKEVRGLLDRLKGRYDLIFGHMKAIGTFDHRVFMEVAYAYQDKFKFALCTDEQAITTFSELPTEDSESNIYVILTKDAADDDEDFHSIKYTRDLTLQAFAKFLMILSLPKMFIFPQEGLENPYAKVDAPSVHLYCNKASRDDVMDKASLIAGYYWGYLTILIIDMDEVDAQELYPYEGQLPAISLKYSPEGKEIFMTDKFDTENMAQFLETRLQGQEKKLSEEERKQDYTPAPPPELEEPESQQIYIDNEEIDKQDDEVAAVVVKKCKTQPLGHVPALTDKTFPTTIHDVSTAVVNFYLPFDALNQAFLCKFGEAADRLGEMTKLSIRRVNCYDWTDVCAQQNITVFPTLRVFNSGHKLWDYRGPKDAQELYSTLRIMELSPPVYLGDAVNVMEYLLGNMVSDVKSFSNVTVVGLFNKENKQEMEVFAEVAKETRDRILFVYSDIEDIKQIASQFKTKVPAVILSRYDDSIQPHVIYTGTFQPDGLKGFVQENKLPRLTTLTPLVFPELYKRGSDFVILFTDYSPGCQDQENVMREVLKTGLYNNVSFTLMPVPDENSVGYKVLSQYTSNPSVPFISYVSLKMGEVYNFEAQGFQKRHLVDWISSIIRRTIQPSTVLKDNEWKPLQKAYDFLKMIDLEKAEAKKKKQKERNSEETGQEEIREELGDLMAQVPVVEDVDEETRQELFELHNSRLYHKSPDREKSHKHAGGKAGTTQKQEPTQDSETPKHEHTEL